nr:tetratricopeptide repeat protein [Azospirillum argentinense]
MSRTVNSQASLLSDHDIERWRQNIRAGTFSNYHHQMGLALIREGSLDAAEAAFQRALQIDPRRFETWHQLVALYRRKGQEAQAEASLAKARVHDPDSVAIGLATASRDVVDDDSDQALAMLIAAASQSPRAVGHAPDAVVQVAQELIKHDRYTEALELLGRLPAEQQDWVDVRFERGLCYRYLGMYRAAMNEFQAILDQEPQSAKAQFNFALLLMFSLRFDEADGAFGRLRAERPSQESLALQAWLYQGVGRLAGGRFDDADAILSALLATHPDMATAQAYRGLCRLRMGQLEEARADMAAASQAEGKHWLVHSLNGIVLMALGLTTEAIASFATATTLVSPAPRLSRLGLAAARLANGQEAPCPVTDAERQSEALPFWFALLGPQGIALCRNLGLVETVAGSATSS